MNYGVGDIPFRHIPCARTRRLLARWCLGPVTCTCNHGKKYFSLSCRWSSFPRRFSKKRNRLESGHRWVLDFRYHLLVTRCTVPHFKCEVIRDGGKCRAGGKRSDEGTEYCYSVCDLKTIDWFGVGFGDICEFAEVRVAVFMLDN